MKITKIAQTGGEKEKSQEKPYKTDCEICGKKVSFNDNDMKGGIITCTHCGEGIDVGME